FFAINLREALAQAHHQAAMAQQKNVELESLKEDLEHLVSQRTQELTRALETVTALSAPVLPVAEGVIILPLVGHADEARMRRVMITLLAGIRAHRAQIAILDITGLTVVDAVVVTSLVDAAQGARLLGCRLVLVGVRAEIARLLVNLDIDLSAITTRANLRTGLDYALQHRHPG
ncbi:MAG: STAS domain-containing protein, partial [Chloroflexi bacterium]|nr:STAS domain-containing protein [Chloroflexota bacterium]